jgi:hypothetical protein
MMTAGFNAALCPDHVKELYGVLDSETFALMISTSRPSYQKSDGSLCISMRLIGHHPQ